MADQKDPLARIYRRYVEVETRAASALESLVGSNAFGELLAMSASNAMALVRHANGGLDAAPIPAATASWPMHG